MTLLKRERVLPAPRRRCMQNGSSRYSKFLKHIAAELLSMKRMKWSTAFFGRQDLLSGPCLLASLWSRQEVGAERITERIDHSIYRVLSHNLGLYKGIEKYVTSEMVGKGRLE